MLRLGSGDGYSRACSEFGQRPRSNRPLTQTRGRFACRVPFKEALGQYSIYNGQKYEFAHMRFFDGPSLRRQLAEAGLKPLKTFCFGYQSYRLKPILPGRVLGKAFDLCGLYGKEWHDFNRKSRSLPLRPLRLLHQPLELLVFSQKT